MLFRSEKINPILRGWVKYFAIGHSSRCFSYIRYWVEKKIRRHLARACQRQGCGWKRWGREWLYGTLGLFSSGRFVHPLLRGHYSPFIATTDSFANPIWLFFPSALASCKKSLQVATSPCCQRVLPDSISANLSPDAWPPAPTVPPSARTCFFPDVIGLPQDTMGRLPVSFRERDFPRDSCRGCRHFVMFRPLSLRRLPDRSHRCESPHRAAETFTSGHIVLCYLRTLRICYPSDTGN